MNIQITIWNEWSTRHAFRSNHTPIHCCSIIFLCVSYEGNTYITIHCLLTEQQYKDERNKRFCTFVYLIKLKLRCVVRPRNVSNDKNFHTVDQYSKRFVYNLDLLNENYIQTEIITVGMYCFSVWNRVNVTSAVH